MKESGHKENNLNDRSERRTNEAKSKSIRRIRVYYYCAAAAALAMSPGSRASNTMYVAFYKPQRRPYSVHTTANIIMKIYFRVDSIRWTHRAFTFQLNENTKTFDEYFWNRFYFSENKMESARNCDVFLYSSKPNVSFIETNQGGGEVLCVLCVWCLVLNWLNRFLILSLINRFEREEKTRYAACASMKWEYVTQCVLVLCTQIRPPDGIKK